MGARGSKPDGSAHQPVDAAAAETVPAATRPVSDPLPPGEEQDTVVGRVGHQLTSDRFQMDSLPAADASCWQKESLVLAAKQLHKVGRAGRR